MKSFIKTYTAVYESLCKDIVTEYPSLIGDTQRDFDRLLRSIEHEGLGFLTITHSHMEKAFLSALSQKKRLGSETGLVRGFGHKSSVDLRPVYLHGLFSLIFSSEGNVLDVPDPRAVFFLRQWFSLARKAELPCAQDRVDETLLEWELIDRSLPDHWPNTWDSDEPQWQRRSGHPLYGDNFYATMPLFPEESVPWDLGSTWSDFNSFCAVVVGQFGIFDPWVLRPKHGPGATADQKRGLKYEFPTWSAKLQSIFPWDFFACSDLGSYKKESGLEPAEEEVPCVMYAVPKTQEGPRLIAAEPTCNQWIQGGIQRWFEDRVAASSLRRCINFRDQSVSQRLALESSRSGSHATVDLSSASDRLSSRLVEYVFQCNPALLDGLHACRSRLVRLPNGHLARMRKFAPMGSAVCFPIQTIVFTILALYSMKLARGGNNQEVLDRYTSEVRVFGDDIIIPTDAYQILTLLLASLKLKVNESKSFASGKFREACGMDAFDGVNVTPVKVRKVYTASNPSTLASVVESANNLFDKGLWHSANALLETVPQSERKLLTVGMPVGGAVSLSEWSGLDNEPLVRGYDQDLHIQTVRCITILSRTAMRRSDGDAGLVQFFFEEPDPAEIYSSGQSERSVQRKAARFVPFEIA